MTERPILFSAAMVRAILDARKTQTRRVLIPQPAHDDVTEISELPALDPVLKCVVSGHSGKWEDGHGLDLHWKCPFGVPGDRLWVRETFFHFVDFDRKKQTWFRADIGTSLAEGRWKPSIFMPRELSRITLEVTAVRAERLQAITGEECIAEGIGTTIPVLTAYRILWDSLNAKRGYGWDTNPWVWVIAFRRVTP